MHDDPRHHPLIEEFLAAVRKTLRGLPPELRANELHELAQHLELLALDFEARGLDAARAAAAAIERFGRAERIGRDLHRAARRAERRSPVHYLKFFLGYGGFIVALYLALFWSMGDPMPAGLPWVIAVNALALPCAFIYADLRKRRRDAAPSD